MQLSTPCEEYTPLNIEGYYFGGRYNYFVGYKFIRLFVIIIVIERAIASSHGIGKT
jgi:hypothetical protein